MIGPIDSIEFRMTSNTADHLAQLQYRASQYNYCLGTRSNASSFSKVRHFGFNHLACLSKFSN